ncbi:hypothetical protein PG985_006349 [Apiospora marii]|uniref:Solute carrier family 40 protein n=1 Tax=Apiospora marii TaxID=335849 RepID=A0ABR1S7C4_9PEZI
MANSSDPAFGYSVLPNQASRGLFQRFFPAWNDGLQVWLHSDCASQLQDYQRGKSAYHAIDCLLQHFPEFRKAEMAVSSVILGLIPVVIQQLGATTIEIGALSLRRPLLSAILALGSPAVIPKRAGDYTPQSVGWNGGNNNNNNNGQVVTESSGVAMRKYILWHGVLHYAVYAAALASLGNVAYLSYQLGYQAVTWLLYTATSVHLAFGTMVLASLLFVRIADATMILGRFIASTIVNRLILVYEFTRIQQLGFIFSVGMPPTSAPYRS